MSSLQELRFPIGEFKTPRVYTEKMLSNWLGDLATFPQEIRAVSEHLSDEQLDTPYREGGWTVRQVIHHCADSHMNSYTRVKLSLTEENPTIKPYFEDRWAELLDAKSMPIEPSLRIIEGIHRRWVHLLQSLSSSDLEQTFEHPEHQRAFLIKEVIAFYAWHSKHHLAHIKSLAARKGWQIMP